MSGVVLVGVNDARGSFAAADAAIAHARRTGSTLRAVAIVESEGVGLALSEETGIDDRREQACEAALTHVARQAADAGVDVETVVRHGRVAGQILAEADACDASIIVLGRMERPGHVITKIGSHTLHVVEFARVPVLVVPADSERGPRP